MLSKIILFTLVFLVYIVSEIVLPKVQNNIMGGGVV